MVSSRSAVRRLAFARVVSMTGTEAAFVALAFEVYLLTNSTIWLSAMLFLTFGLTGLIRPFAGALGDRFDRRRVMVTSEVLGAGAFVSLPFMHTPMSLLVVAAVAAIVATPFGPASAAALPNLVQSEDDLPWANSRLSMSATIGGTVGPALGGAITGWFGASSVFWLNAVSFAASALLILGVRGAFSKPASEDSGEHRGLMAGFRKIRGDRLLTGLAIYWVLTYFAVDIVLVGDLPLVKSFGLGSFGFGLLLAIGSAGAVIGYWIAGRMSREQERAALLVGTGMVAVGYVTTAVAPWFSLAAIGVGAAGGFYSVGYVAGYSMIQRGTPDEVRARVFGAFASLGMLGNTLAFLVAGFLVGWLGPRPLYVIGASVAVAAAAILAVYTKSSVPVQG